jgi:copper chaperone
MMDYNLFTNYIKKGSDMLNFQVSGMTCGGCVNAVTRAIRSKDLQAQVTVDLAKQQIELNTTLSIEQARELIEEAGFPVIS